MTFERPDIFRPPSERASYFLPLTNGCSNNTCTFCSYCGTKLQVRDAADVKREIDALVLFLRDGITIPDVPPIVFALARHWDGRRIFLQDGDALVYPYPQLRDILEHLNQELPFITRIAAYATAQDILRRSPDELKELARLKLGILYIGLESGDDEVLQKIAKGVTSRQVIEAVKRAKEAGILTSVTVILGLGGVEGSRKHALETARALSEMDPDYAGALTLTLVPGTPFYDDVEHGRFSLISPFQSLEELKLIVENSRFTNCFFSSMHASNYISIRGTLPQDKEKILAQLESVIAKGDPSMLRPEFYRGL